MLLTIATEILKITVHWYYQLGIIVCCKKGDYHNL